ncbi:LysR family transcriptional regulator [Trinickia terrae]|uniref:LysR family transcriptional regulator n=1 Tax=Trinickia terrae TaxID=2571161 RepID=A0A4U1IDU7_9BURK|nr:LysR substrate-binding domain-containing protein [Trinickia terrae]TKC91836.1 LysR family transcriptional regulator [Trinickia terrae]
MEIKWIEDFLALAQHMSFSRAAEARSVTQSGFSRRIKSLEEWIGAELIDRSAYPPPLTSAGKLLRENAEEILRLVYDTRSMIRNQQRTPGIALQIAAGHTISLNFLPPWLSSLNERCGEISARVVALDVHEAIQMIVSGNCDLLLAYHHPELPLRLDPHRFAHVTIGRDVLAPLAAPRSRGEAAHALPGTKARPVPLLAYSEDSFFGRCLGLVKKRGPAHAWLHPVYEADMAELLKKMALQGHGAAWLPKSAVTRELADGSLVEAGGAAWSLPLEIRLYRDLSNENAALERVWNVVAGA